MSRSVEADTDAGADRTVAFEVRYGLGEYRRIARDEARRVVAALPASGVGRVLACAVVVVLASSTAWAVYAQRPLIATLLAVVTALAAAWSSRRTLPHLASGLACLAALRSGKLKPLYAFRIDADGVERSHAGHAARVPWSRIEAVHRYAGVWLFALRTGGALPVPLRVLDAAQRERLQGLIQQYVIADAVS